MCQHFCDWDLANSFLLPWPGWGGGRLVTNLLMLAEINCNVVQHKTMEYPPGRPAQKWQDYGNMTNINGAVEICNYFNYHDGNYAKNSPSSPSTT